VVFEKIGARAHNIFFICIQHKSNTTSGTEHTQEAVAAKKGRWNGGM
jgi:hypothetical protein